MKQHIKLYEQFLSEKENISEAFRVVSTGSSLDLEGAGVEVPDFRIDLTRLKEKHQKATSLIYRMDMLRKESDSPEAQIDMTKVEKELEAAVKTYNEDSKKTFKEFEKVLRSVKFPADAKYEVEVEERKEGEFGKYSPKFMDFNNKKPLILFDAWIRTEYHFLATRDRNEKDCKSFTHWSALISNKVTPSAYRGIYVPTVLDKEFLLDTFLNLNNTNRRF